MGFWNKVNAALTDYEAGEARRAAKLTKDEQRKKQLLREAEVSRRQAALMRKAK